MGLLDRYRASPQEIYQRGVAVARSLLPPLSLSPTEEEVALQLLRATGDPALPTLLRFSPGAVETGVQALRSGAPIVADSHVTLAGIDRQGASRLGCPLVCALDAAGAEEEASRRGITRSAAAMLLSREAVEGAVVAVGTAPTALLALLDLWDEGLARPALVIGAPVGLVLAPEAKEELMARSLPYIAIVGSRGGGGAAAAIVNALIGMARAGTTRSGLALEGGERTSPSRERGRAANTKGGGTT
ncbi:MAG: precorrin-8X methylmutase [Dehalococcoidia bacterium]|nr:precorrin-8X methylmutase [Dehalococcoidia bacterium]MDW8008745.1 precorrin-8X methylmutase [Chloroflexota bacterium]